MQNPVPALAIIVVVSLAFAAHAQPAAKTATVRIINFEFQPAAVAVAQGAVVTWINGDDDAHSVVADKGAFRSKALDTNDKFSFTFNRPGEYDFHCGLHPHMVGKVIVKSRG